MDRIYHSRQANKRLLRENYLTSRFLPEYSMPEKKVQTRKRGNRKMFTKTGIISLFAGLVVAVFTGISKFMGSQNFWVDLTISKLLGNKASESFINFTDVAVIQDSLYFLMVELPFSAFLIGLGVVLLVLSLFFKNY